MPVLGADSMFEVWTERTAGQRDSADGSPARVTRRFFSAARCSSITREASTSHLRAYGTDFRFHRQPRLSAPACGRGTTFRRSTRLPIGLERYRAILPRPPRSVFGEGPDDRARHAGCVARSAPAADRSSCIFMAAKAGRRACRESAPDQRISIIRRNMVRAARRSRAACVVEEAASTGFSCRELPASSVTRRSTPADAADAGARNHREHARGDAQGGAMPAAAASSPHLKAYVRRPAMCRLPSSSCLHAAFGTTAHRVPASRYLPRGPAAGSRRRVFRRSRQTAGADAARLIARAEARGSGQRRCSSAMRSSL